MTDIVYIDSPKKLILTNLGDFGTKVEVTDDVVAFTRVLVED